MPAMSSIPSCDLYIDINAPGGAACLLDGETSQNLQTAPQWIFGDCFPINLHFRQKGGVGNNSTAVALPTVNLVLGAKDLSGLSATTLLFSCTAFTPQGSDDALCYQALLNLNTEELLTDLGSQKSITARVNVEIQNPDDSQRLSYQFDVTIQEAAYDGEASPTPGTPQYPVPTQLVTKLCGSVALTQGQQVIPITGMNLGSVPSVVLCSIRKPAAGADALAGNVIAGTLTTDGFSVELGAPVPAAGYVLDYLVIL